MAHTIISKVRQRDGSGTPHTTNHHRLTLVTNKVVAFYASQLASFGVGEDGNSMLEQLV
jgi:hypothetical protein